MNDITSRPRVAAPVALAIFVLVAAGLLSLGTTSGTAAQSQYAPKNTAAPTIRDGKAGRNPDRERRYVDG